MCVSVVDEGGVVRGQCTGIMRRFECQVREALFAAALNTFLAMGVGERRRKKKMKKGGNEKNGKRLGRMEERGSSSQKGVGQRAGRALRHAMAAKRRLTSRYKPTVQVKEARRRKKSRSTCYLPSLYK